MITSYNTIQEAWYFECKNALKNGYKYIIDKGSFIGHERSQLNALAFIIKMPNTRPLSLEFKTKTLVTDEQIEQYFTKYLASCFLSENETYTYGSRISKNLLIITNMLKNTPMTNQATTTIANNSDTGKIDPPCLITLSWKVVNGKLNLTSYWRSWDLAQALPINLGGLQLLNEFISNETCIPTGELICFSDGAHVYDTSYYMF